LGIGGQFIDPFLEFFSTPRRKTIDFSSLSLFPKLFTVREEPGGLKLLKSGVDAAMLSGPKMLP